MSDAAIKKSAEDTSGFEPLRSSPDRLKSGAIFEEFRQAVINQVMELGLNYTDVIVIDYINHEDHWDHNLVNFYYSNDEDPTTTIVSFRVTPVVRGGGYLVDSTTEG